MSLAMSTEMTEAAQPMPDRLTVRMLDLNLKCLTTAADSDGVGLKAVQLMMRPSICGAGEALKTQASRWERHLCNLISGSGRLPDATCLGAALRLSCADPPVLVSLDPYIIIMH